MLEPAYVINPEDDLILNLLAEAYVAAGDRAAGLLWLQRLQRVSPCFFHMPENSASVLDPKESESSLNLLRQMTGGRIPAGLLSHSPKPTCFLKASLTTQWTEPFFLAAFIKGRSFASVCERIETQWSKTLLSGLRMAFTAHWV